MKFCLHYLNSFPICIWSQKKYLFSHSYEHCEKNTPRIVFLDQLLGGQKSFAPNFGCKKGKNHPLVSSLLLNVMSVLQHEVKRGVWPQSSTSTILADLLWDRDPWKEWELRTLCLLVGRGNSQLGRHFFCHINRMFKVYGLPDCQTIVHGIEKLREMVQHILNVWGGATIQYSILTTHDINVIFFREIFWRRLKLFVGKSELKFIQHS